MVIIKRVHIKRFRGIEDKTLEINTPVNAIIGKNGSMKTTLLGLMAHPFSLKTSAMEGERSLIGNSQFNSPMRDKFKFSDEFDIPGQHEWSLTIDKRIYHKEKYTCLSERRTDNDKLRFWSTEGRGANMNAIQCPVIYLSMKRLNPIGEERNLRVDDCVLTEEEKRMYIEFHNKILICTENIEEVQNVHSTSKYTLGPKTSTTDAWTISAGQDNVGRIILAVLSMIRLKEKYGREYKGGIIFIDEMESTLYPAAQEKLIEFMYDTAQKYKLQYFFTTHSISAINFLKVGKYNSRNTIFYLRKLGGSIKIESNPSLKDIQNNLNVEAGKRTINTKIKVYCEDEVGCTFCKYFLPPDIKTKVKFINNMDLPWTVYKTLYTHKVPEFLENIILLDGDVKDEDMGWKRYPRNTNITYLPSLCAPERMIYNMLYNLEETDDFWDNESLSGYDKSVCFRDFPNRIEDIDQIKEWFDGQREYAGRGYSKFLKEWKRRNESEVDAFRTEFIRAYNYVAEKVGMDKLEDIIGNNMATSAQ